MYVATRSLKADGKLYNAGDPVPAETWKTKRALLSLGWIVYLPGIEEAEPAEAKAPPAAQEDGQPTSAEGAEEEKETDQVAELLALSVSKLEETLEGITDQTLLQTLLEREGRKTAIGVIEARLKALGGV